MRKYGLHALPPHDPCIITTPPKNTSLKQIAKVAAPKDMKAWERRLVDCSKFQAMICLSVILALLHFLMNHCNLVKWASLPPMTVKSLTD